MKEDPKNKRPALSLDGKVLIHELGKLQQEFARLFGVDEDRRFTVNAGLGNSDLPRLANEDLDTSSGFNPEAVLVNDSHDITLNLRFRGGKLKSAKLEEDGRPIVFVMPAQGQPAGDEERGGHDSTVEAIESLLALIFEADIKGCTIYGKRLTETATWENAICSLKAAKLLTGQRGQVACRKLEELVSGVPGREINSESSEKHGSRANDLLSDGGGPKKLSLGRTVDQIQDNEQGPNCGQIVGGVRLDESEGLIEEPTGGMLGVFHNEMGGTLPEKPGEVTREIDHSTPTPHCP